MLPYWLNTEGPKQLRHIRYGLQVWLRLKFLPSAHKVGLENGWPHMDLSTSAIHFALSTCSNANDWLSIAARRDASLSKRRKPPLANDTAQGLNFMRLLTKSSSKEMLLQATAYIIVSLSLKAFGNVIQ